MEKCIFCEKESEYIIEGYVSNGDGEGYATQLVCSVHVKSYIDWFFEDGANHGDERIHGLWYVDEIKVIKPNKACSG